MSEHDPAGRHIREIRGGLGRVIGELASVWMRISELEAKIRVLEEADETDGLADRIETLERRLEGATVDYGEPPFRPDPEVSR